MGKAILKITDGTATNTVDLLSRGSGYILCDWQPARPALEYIIDKNWFSGREVPSSVTQKPIIDTFTLNAMGADVDSLISYEQKLNRILYMASIYWTGSKSVSSPFYIVAKGKNETGTRYAAIFSAQLHSSSNPYSQPFFSENPMDKDLIIPITHGEWLDYPPGTGGVDMHEAVGSILDSVITGYEQGAFLWNGDYGPVLSNFISHDCISHMYKGSFDINVMSSGFPSLDMGLFSTGLDFVYTYLGIEHVGLVSETPMHSGVPGIYFNVTTPAILDGSPPDFKWEIYIDDAGTVGWAEIFIDDNTAGLTEPGVVFFNFDTGSGVATWVSSTVNGVVGHWVRISPLNTFLQIPKVSIMPPSVPSVAFFDASFIGNDHVASGPDIAPDFLPGSNGIYLDIGLKLIVPSWITPLAETNTTKMYIGARSLIGSSDHRFNGFIPVYDPAITYNTPNVSGVKYELPAGSSIVSDSDSYTGYVFKNTVSLTSAGEEDLYLSLAFGSVPSAWFHGTFKMFIRVKTQIDTNSGSVFFAAGVSPTIPYVDGEFQSGLSKTRWVTDCMDEHYLTTLDIGSITLGSRDNMPEFLNIYYRFPFLEPLSVYLIDVILIPQDEWYAELSFPADSDVTSYRRKLNLGSITPSGDIKATVSSFGQTHYIPSIIPGIPLSLLGNDTRFTILSTVHDIGKSITGEVNPVPIQYSSLLQFYEVSDIVKVNKYFSSRGTR